VLNHILELHPGCGLVTYGEFLRPKYWAKAFRNCFHYSKGNSGNNAQPNLQHYKQFDKSTLSRYSCLSSASLAIPLATNFSIFRGPIPGTVRRSGEGTATFRAAFGPIGRLWRSCALPAALFPCKLSYSNDTESMTTLAEFFFCLSISLNFLLKLTCLQHC
jgi:hypothetical protein